MVKLKLEFIGKLKGNNLKWFGGFEYLNNRLDTVDIDNLNKGRDPDDFLPAVGGGLYGNFIRWGLIPERSDPWRPDRCLQDRSKI